MGDMPFALYGPDMYQVLLQPVWHCTDIMLNLMYNDSVNYAATTMYNDSVIYAARVYCTRALTCRNSLFFHGIIVMYVEHEIVSSVLFGSDAPRHWLQHHPCLH